MQFFLHHLDGTQQVVQLTPEITMEALLQGTGSRLVYQGTNLTSLDKLLDNANVYVTSDLDGGKKKKKKKVYTTKKKNKHIHKKIKLLTLSLYSVDGNFDLIKEKAMSPNRGKPVPPVVLEPSWLSTGIATIVDSATQPSRWTQKPWKRTKKRCEPKRKPSKPKEEQKRKKQQIRPQQAKERKTLRKERRNEIFV